MWCESTRWTSGNDCHRRRRCDVHRKLPRQPVRRGQAWHAITMACSGEQGRGRFGDPRAYRKLVRKASRTPTPTKRPSTVQGDQRRHEVLPDPENAARRPWGDPWRTPPWRAGGFWWLCGLGDVRGVLRRRNRQPRRSGGSGPGSTRCFGMRLILSECATGVTKQVAVDTAVLCDLCQGKGTHGFSPAGHLCRHLRRPRRTADGAALAARPGDDVTAVPLNLRRRRRGQSPTRATAAVGTGAPRDQRQDPGRRR